MTPRLRIVVPFVGAPVLTWLGGCLAFVVPVALMEGFASAAAFVGLAIDMLKTLTPWAYGAEIVLGIPAYVLITRRGPLRFGHCLSVAAAIGALVGAVAPIRDVAIVVMTGLLGAASGFVFWILYLLTSRRLHVAA